jgi:uncharacterized membrane protein
LATASAGEFSAVNLMKVVRHHGRPQIWGIPVTALLSWYVITYAAFDTASAYTRGWLRAVLTALIATSLDLLLDVYGLGKALWEWRDDGMYAREIVGPNGRRGIPVGNYIGWLLMTGAIASAFVKFTGKAKEQHHGVGGLLLLAYYGPAAVWAVRTRRLRYIAYGAIAPLSVFGALLRARRDLGRVGAIPHLVVYDRAYTTCRRCAAQNPVLGRRTA